MIFLKRIAKHLILKFTFCIPPLLNQYHIKIPSIYGLGFQNRIISEKWMSNLIELLFEASPKTTFFLDVGVNIGQTLLKVKAINRDIKYIGFEPNSDCCFYTRRLSELNALQHVQIVPCALSDGHGLATLYADELGASDATIVQDLRDREYGLPAQHVVRLPFDELSHQLVGEEHAIVKIDVEGGELEVLSGMEQYIARARPIIICEILHSDSLSKVAGAIQKNKNIMDLLVGKNYKVFRVLKSRNEEQFIGLYQIDEFSSGVWNQSISPFYCDYVFAPLEFKNISEICVDSVANAHLPAQRI